MSETEQGKPEDELELAPETVEDLDAEGDDVKGGELPRETEDLTCH